MTPITEQELLTYLNEIIDCDAFELHIDSAASSLQNFFIPYMMNDALECYLLLTDGQMTGVYHTDSKEPIRAESVRHDQNTALIFHQGNENVFTIWYQEAFRVLECYRYDQIGHFWMQGQEQWRRLVYMIGTIHDKYHYMGTEVCNAEEIALLPLMEFAPFRSYSPIHESLDAYYHESSDGLECMKMLAAKAHDREFLRLLRLYECLYPVIPCQKPLIRLLSRALSRPSRIRLYETIYARLTAAASRYPQRRYSETAAREIADSRTNVTNTLKSRGFSGEYPLFHRGTMQVFAVEEHPFTILESEQYHFKIQYMISETTQNGPYPLNSGFFQKDGYRGWIAKDLNF